MRKARRSDSAKVTAQSYHTSLNDLLIGLIFIFIILLVASALSYQRLQIELDERPAMRLALLEALRADLAANRIENVVIDGQNGVLRLPEDALFDEGESIISPERQDALGILAQALARRLPCYADEQGRRGCPDDTAPILEAVYVEGHTDDQAMPSLPFGNWDLSSDRAIRTYRTLLAAAPSLATIRSAQGRSTLLGVSAYADERPVRDNLTEAHKSENRRIDLRFLLSPRAAR